MKKAIIVVVLFMTIFGCQKNKKLMIVSMNDYINIDYVNKDPGNDVQFFEIDNYSEYPSSHLMDSILAFSEKELSKNNQMPPKVRMQYFYRETLFGACGDELVDLDSDFYEEGLQDCMDQSVALIWLFPSNDKKNDSIFNRKITYWTDKGEYVKDYGLQSDGTRSPDVYRTIYFTRRDSILIKGKTWKILKKGKIKRN